jgi:hypothetical protein
MKLLRAAAFAAILVFPGASCGSSSPDDPPSDTPRTETPTPVPPPPPAPPPPPPPPVAADDLVWGANGHPFTAHPGISWERQLDLVKQLGATQYRVNLGGTTTTADLQRLVDLANARGIQIVPVLSPPVPIETETAEVIRSRSYDYARQFAAAFKGRMPVWELGNELEVYAIILPCEMQDNGVQYSCSYGPGTGVGPLEYFGPRWAKVSAAFKGLSEGVMAADPGALKAMGTAGWGHTGAFDRMKADGIQWDISVWHDYDGDNTWAMEKLATFGKPIWITEFNHPGGSTNGEAAQADGVQQRIAKYRGFRERFKVQAAHVYELLDEPYWTGFESVMGLYRVTRNASGQWEASSPKPAFTRMQDLIDD